MPHEFLHQDEEFADLIRINLCSYSLEYARYSNHPGMFGKFP